MLDYKCLFLHSLVMNLYMLKFQNDLTQNVSMDICSIKILNYFVVKGLYKLIN